MTGWVYIIIVVCMAGGAWKGWIAEDVKGPISKAVIAVVGAAAGLMTGIILAGILGGIPNLTNQTEFYESTDQNE